MRWLVERLLNAFFARVEYFHPERVPASGPILIVSNHPGSVADAFVIGTAVRRKVNFVATVQLFRWAPLAWFLRKCGVIPVNRVKDDPKAMQTVAVTFEACLRVFNQGGAVGLFPEGITYEDDQLKPIKTGAARLALAFEEQRKTGAPLQIVPVGLTYSAKDRFRSTVLAHFGQPFTVQPWLEQHRTAPHEAVHALIDVVTTRLRELIVNVSTLENARIVAAVKRLYFPRLKQANLIVTEPMTPQAEELVLSQAIVNALDHVRQHHGARLERFVTRLNDYERLLRRMGLDRDGVERDPASLPGRLRVRVAVFLIFAAPIALYGWVHLLVPVLIVVWAARRLTILENRRAHVALTTMLAGLIVFVAFFALYVWLVRRWFGWLTVGYALSLPWVCGVALLYGRVLLKQTGRWRAAAVLARAPFARRLLARRRAALVADIEALRYEYVKTLVPALDAPGLAPRTPPAAM